MPTCVSLSGVHAPARLHFDETVFAMPSSLAQAYRLYFPLLVQKCARMLGDAHEAQDLAQETFVRLHAAGLSGDEPRLVSAWLYRVSTRLAIDRLRAQKRHAADSEAVDALRGGDSPEAEISTRSLLSALAGRVPEAELEVALLTRVDGLTQPEAAEVLGIHERSVRRLLERFDQKTQVLREGRLS